MASTGIENVSGSPKQPDIHYRPDFRKYQDRRRRRLQNEPLSKELPDGFPQQLKSTLVWTRSDFSDEEWITVLTEADNEEIAQALAYFKGLKLPHGQICQETFPLGSLGPRLRSLSEEVHCGRGFVVLRSFPVEKFNREDTVLAYAGVSSYIASLRALSDRSGAVMVHVTDISKEQNVATPVYTNDKQVFHTDNGDIVSLLAIGVADQGGSSKLTSSWQVYNILAKTRPDLIQTMSEPWPCDNFGGDPEYYMRPIMYYTPEQRLIVQYFRRLFTCFGSRPRPSTIPPITEAQAEALDALEFTARENCISMDLQKGDVQYINNLSILHARDGFADSEANRRHLLRMWLRDEEFGWKIPGQLQSGPGRSWDALRHEKFSNAHRFPLYPEVKLE